MEEFSKLFISFDNIVFTIDVINIILTKFIITLESIVNIDIGIVDVV
jgi:hypothetical protein